MYQVSEKTLDEFLNEANHLIDKVSSLNVLDHQTVNHFGMALLAVQTEVHQQQTVQFNGLFHERLNT